MATTIDLKKKNDADLVALLAEKHEAVRVFRFGGAGGRARNVRLAKTLRKEIAQIMTEMTKRASAPVLAQDA